MRIALEKRNGGVLCRWLIMNSTVLRPPIQKAVRDVIEASRAAEERLPYEPQPPRRHERAGAEAGNFTFREAMKQAAKDLEFERAAQLRDLIFKLRKAGKEDGLE